MVVGYGCKGIGESIGPVGGVLDLIILKKRVDFIMKFGIMIIAKGQDVKPYTGIAYKETNLAPYFSDLRRMPIGGTYKASGKLLCNT